MVSQYKCTFEDKSEVKDKTAEQPESTSTVRMGQGGVLACVSACVICFVSPSRTMSIDAVSCKRKKCAPYANSFSWYIYYYSICKNGAFPLYRLEKLIMALSSLALTHAGLWKVGQRKVLTNFHLLVFWLFYFSYFSHNILKTLICFFSFILFFRVYTFILNIVAFDGTCYDSAPRRSLCWRTAD